MITKSGAKVFIDADNEHLMGIADGLELVKYGVDTKAGDVVVKGEVKACDPFLRFTWNGGEVQTHLIGAYNIYNMLAAATIGLHFGVTPEQVNEALAGYVPSNNRSQLTVTDRNKLIVDTYNANPTSMIAALKNFTLMTVSPKMAILGDMRELGSVSAAEHQKVIDYLKKEHIDDVSLVGEEFGKTVCSYRKFHNVDEVKQELNTNPVTGKYILIKGSNGIKLFELPELL